MEEELAGSCCLCVCVALIDIEGSLLLPIHLSALFTDTSVNKTISNVSVVRFVTSIFCLSSAVSFFIVRHLNRVSNNDRVLPEEIRKNIVLFFLV